ncbi:3-deoxy-7-phosphoheptulonate synthase [Candidatus Gracilibacteria bacterium]|nr:3-deoxy-7-phosphoheptulonate synthase [Candidatus Gracilibacteria bacterium]
MSKKSVAQLPSVESIKNKFPLSAQGKEVVEAGIADFQKILSGEDSRKGLVIGPCSADFEESLEEYAEFLSGLREKYGDKILFLMRFYTGKPRTVGGWKGLSYSVPGEEPDLLLGMENTRRIAIKLIEKYKLPLAEEMLHPEMSDYFDDIYSYQVVGARSVENQYHREVMSGVNCPAGLKNHTLGDLQFMVNAIAAASLPSSYVTALGEVYETSGNKYAHGIHRGAERGETNYNLGSILQSYNLMEDKNIENKAIVIDCNHDNSKKNPEKQIQIISEVMQNISSQKEVYDFVKGFMVESYLYDGRQDIEDFSTVKKGLSMTDPCIGLEGTEMLVKELYSLVK